MNDGARIANKLQCRAKFGQVDCDVRPMPAVRWSGSIEPQYIVAGRDKRCCDVPPEKTT
jgi:hypothetical protein